MIVADNDISPMPFTVCMGNQKHMVSFLPTTVSDQESRFSWPVLITHETCVSGMNL